MGARSAGSFFGLVFPRSFIFQHKVFLHKGVLAAGAGNTRGGSTNRMAPPGSVTSSPSWDFATTVPAGEPAAVAAIQDAAAQAGASQYSAFPVFSTYIWEGQQEHGDQERRVELAFPFSAEDQSRLTAARERVINKHHPDETPMVLAKGPAPGFSEIRQITVTSGNGRPEGELSDLAKTLVPEFAACAQLDKAAGRLFVKTSVGRLDAALGHIAEKTGEATRPEVLQVHLRLLVQGEI